MFTAPNPLAIDPPKVSGRHILIVEDEMMIALSLIDTVTSLGFTSAAASRIAKALALVATQRFDAAILDMNLAGERSSPVADALSLSGTPFIITTGYDTDGIAPAYRDRPRLSKPYTSQQVEDALNALGFKALA